jgi:hypothetical protein
MYMPDRRVSQPMPDRRVLLKDRFPYAKDTIETIPKLMTDMYAGGKVPTTHIGRPPKFMTVRIMTKGVDQVPSLLQQGELVIPKKHTPMVEEFLRQQNIYLPNMEQAPKTGFHKMPDGTMMRDSDHYTK